jgi:DNA-binding NarL/FixJ family response regulator
MTRVLIVADRARWLGQIRLRLRARRGWQVVSEVSDGLEAVQKAQELRPDLILIDVGLSNLNGIETARRIRRLSPESEILFLSQEFDADVVQETLSLGTSGYAMKASAGS